MQLKFITLTLSAVLTISALSVNALPTSKRDTTGQDVTTQNESEAVTPGAQTGNTSQKNVGEVSDLPDDITNIVSDLLDTVESLLGKVVDPLLKKILELVQSILTGKGTQQGLIKQLLEAVEELPNGDKPGRFNNGADAQEPVAPASGNEGILDRVVNLVTNLLGGHSAEESGVEDLIETIKTLLDSPRDQNNGAGASDKHT